jgi:hypothetical protein
MHEKTKRTHDDPEQSKRFIDTSREREADETEEGADKAFKKITSSSFPSHPSARKPSS